MLAKLVAPGRDRPDDADVGRTVEQLIERDVDDRSPIWAPRAADETRNRVAQHIARHLGSIAIERLRPVDVPHLHAVLRAAGLSEGSIGREHDILRADLNWGRAPRKTPGPAKVFGLSCRNRRARS